MYRSGNVSGNLKPESTRLSCLNVMRNPCIEQQVERATDAGGPGEEAYCLLVSELKTALDTSICVGTLQILIPFRFGDGVSFSD